MHIEDKWVLTEEGRDRLYYRELVKACLPSILLEAESRAMSLTRGGNINDGYAIWVCNVAHAVLQEVKRRENA